MSLKNETAIVTGGTSGLGKRITEHLLEQGCRVAICSRHEQHVNATITELSSKYTNANIIGYPCDVADPLAVQSFTNRVAKEFGSLRIVVAFAGFGGLFGAFAYMAFYLLAIN